MKHLTCKVLPTTPAPHVIYRLLPKKESHVFYEERVNRNIGWITKEEQALLKNSVVAIAGCGGMGGLVAATLLRLGVGEIRIADTEVFDTSNLNRQFGATQKTVGTSKAFATAKMLREIANDTIIVVYPQGITEETVESFVEGADVICDEVEFWALGSRMLLHKVSREQDKVLFNCSSAGHSVYCTKFTKDSMTFEEAIGIDFVNATLLQKKIQAGQASKEEIQIAMERMLRIAAPVLQEYSLDTTTYSTERAVRTLLREQTRASIIGTNPPMASGFLSNQVLFELLRQKSTIKRTFVSPPPMPSYVMFDAGFLVCTIHKGVWWGREPEYFVRNSISLSVVSDSPEHQDATVFVRGKYKKHYGTIPKDVPIYIVAKRGSVIVGTMGFERPTKEKPLSISETYLFDRSKIPFPLTDTNVGQCNRWTSDEQNVSLVVVYATALHARCQGLEYLWTEQGVATNKILRRRGVHLVPILDAMVNFEKVEDGDRAFYQNKNPLPYILDVAQTIVALRDFISLKIKEGIVEMGEFCSVD